MKSRLTGIGWALSSMGLAALFLAGAPVCADDGYEREDRYERSWYGSYRDRYSTEDREEREEHEDREESEDREEGGGTGGTDGGSSGGTGGGSEVVAEHQNLTYEGPGTCLECHGDEAHDVFESTHYQWKGATPDMLNATGTLQGKHAGAVNTYCGNILGNWNGCSACHIGLGEEPGATATTAQLENIDCLICHQEAYKRKTVAGPEDSVLRVPDTDNMTITLQEAVRTVHKPTRATCLQCHANAGGGDAVKRGDLALASANTTDKDYDVHMATTGADLACQDCHVPQNHRFPGKGSDLRPTDLDQVLECADCHEASPHDSRDLNRHTAKVACQTCHIPKYGKNASDSAATEATEMERHWQDGSDHTTGPLHPKLVKANDVTPVYRHWNRKSDNYLLGDSAVGIYNGETETYQTSVPDGAVDDQDSKLYPFKYKTSDYPLHTRSDKLIALSTATFFATADADQAALDGLSNMIDAGIISGPADSGDIDWVTTDTYQLLNHQVSSHDDALSCRSCHLSTARMDLQGEELGYAPKSKNTATCSSGCHDADDAREWTMGNFGDFEDGHKEHRGEGISCSRCHGFSR
jgi:hypothetical protein